jgi:hypothetical protein
VLEKPYFVNHLIAAILAYVRYLRRGHVIRYSLDTFDEDPSEEESAPTLIPLTDVREHVGADTARLLASHFYHNANGEPAIERSALVNLLELLTRRLSP